MFERYSHLIGFKEGTTNSVKYRNTNSCIGEEGGKKREGRLKGREEVRERRIKR